MDIRLSNGSVVVVNDPELAEQYIKYGAKEVKPVVKQETPTPKKSKKANIDE